MNIEQLAVSLFALTIFWALPSMAEGLYKPYVIPSPQQIEVKGEKLHPLRKTSFSDRGFIRTHGKDEYVLIIRRGRAIIKGNRIWAEETLRQLLDEKGRVPDVYIHDWAAYPWRGFMHDTGRNFLSVALLEETLDLMARYKLNLFHWHLTDNPAWRIECRCHPELNDARYQRKGRDEGCFYTYDDIRHIIGYARERGIEVLPEIDMPGHSEYFRITFGFTMDSDRGKKILEDCILEFFDEIPVSLCPCLHVGSDEINIADPEGFAIWAQNLVHDNGRIPVVWDPGLPVLPFTVRQIWRAEAAASIKDGSDAGQYVDSFVGYLNYFDPLMFTMRCYQHEAAGQSVPDTSMARGGILCLWNDVRAADKRKISLHNGMIPGMMAFSERFWRGGSGHAQLDENLYPDPSSPQGRELAQMEERMSEHCRRYYTTADVRWKSSASLCWDISLGDREFKAWGGAVDLDALCRSNGLSADEQTSMTARTVMHADRDTLVRAWLGFDVPARSDRMSTGIGLQGCWENDGHCYLNGVEILPPKEWNEPGAYNYHYHTWHRPEEEYPYTDEQFYWMREPVKLQLHKGGNVIEIVNPHSFPGQRWSFAFVPWVN